MVGLSEKQHLAEAPWQRRTVGVPWQRRLAEVLGGACPHGTHHGTQRWMSPGRGNGGCPYGRGDGANGGCPLAEAPGRGAHCAALGGGCPHGRGAWRSTVGVSMAEAPAFDGGCPMADPTVGVPWQTHLWQRRRRQRWVSPGRGAWQRCSAVGVPMAPTNGGCPHGRGAWRGDERWVSPWQRPADGGCPMAEAEATAPTVGVPWHGRGAWQRCSGNGGCPLAEAPGVRRWVSPWQKRRRSTVGVPWQTQRWVSHGRPTYGSEATGCPIAPPYGGCPHGRGAWRSTVGVPWQTQRWVSHGRPTTVDVLWQRQQRWMSSGRGRSAWQRRRWVSPWQRHGSDQRWVSPWPRRSAAVGVPYVEAHTWRRVKLPFFRIGVLEPP